MFYIGFMRASSRVVFPSPRLNDLILTHVPERIGCSPSAHARLLYMNYARVHFLKILHLTVSPNHSIHYNYSQFFRKYFKIKSCHIIRPFWVALRIESSVSKSDIILTNQTEATRSISSPFLDLSA